MDKNGVYRYTDMFIRETHACVFRYMFVKQYTTFFVWLCKKRRYTSVHAYASIHHGMNHIPSWMCLCVSVCTRAFEVPLVMHSEICP